MFGAVEVVQVSLPENAELIGRIVLAAGLGALIGLERELREHPAGIRTHTSVALGACLFGLLSAYGFQSFVTGRDATTYQVDVTRVASQIVVGVGFLGGGAIIKDGSSVRGLTTAASMWVTAAVGMGAALGNYTITLTTAGLLVASLWLMKIPKGWLHRNFTRVHEDVIVHLSKGAEPGPVLAALSGVQGMTVKSLKVIDNDDFLAIKASLTGRGEIRIEDALSAIDARDDVYRIDFS